MGGAAVFLFSLLLTSASCQIVFVVEPEDVLAAAGASVLFNCAFTTSSPSSSLSWLRDGAVLTSDSRYTYHSNGSVQISPVAAEDEGEYTCRVTDSITLETDERSASLTLAYILDSFLVNPDSTTVNEGDSLQLFCIHGGSLPAAAISWTVDSIPVEPSERVSVNSLVLSGTDPPQTSSSLYISSVEPGDEGSYACQARNELLPETVISSSVAHVDVIGLPRPPTITEHPSDATVIPGGDVSFSCSASGQPSPTFSWYHDGVQLSPGGEVTVSTSGGSSTLGVGGVGEEEEGEYLCLAVNSLGSASSESAQLTLAILGSVFQLSPVDAVATVGEDARFDCLPPPSHPSPSLSWTRNYAQLPGERFSVLTNGSLLISSVVLEDQALYHCVATNDLLGVSATSEPAQLTVLSVPTVTPNSISVAIGQSTTFLCEAPGSPPPSLTWYNRTDEITESIPRTTLTPTTLTLSHIVREDQGEYVCQADYINGTTHSSATLWVNAPPLFTDPSVSLTTAEGQNVTLPCSIFPDPSLTFTWFFNDVLISLPDNEEGSPVLLSNGSLHLTSVRDSEEGTYTCEARNNLGAAEGTVQLTVFEAPSLTPSSASVTVTEGDIAVLACIASGDPAPVLSWYHIGTLLVGETGENLTLEGVGREEEGVYECVASNQVGDNRATITLVVQTHPTVEVSPPLLELQIGSTATFTCTSSGNPAPLVTWTNEDGIDVATLGDTRIRVEGGTLTISETVESDSQLLTCTASNVVGSDSSTVTLSVQVPPAVSLPPSLLASQGDPLTLDCTPTGNPPPSLSWLKNNQPLLPSGDDRLTISDQRVVITGLFSTDQGNYSCLASSTQGTASASTFLTVLVIPVIHAGVPMVTVTEGNMAVLDCNSTGNPPPTVSWFHFSLRVPEPDDTRLSQPPNNSLIVEEVEEGDGGVYVCQAVNEAGSETAQIELVVYVAPRVTPLETSITVVEGSEVTLVCSATGNPTPTVTWQRYGGEVPTDSTPNLSVEGGEGEGSLTISPVRGEDGGVWECVGTNFVASNRQSITLTVLIPPSILSLPPTVTITEGTPHTLVCSATGDPPPLITWLRGGVVVSAQGILSLEPSASRTDAGVYTCRATNTAGSDSRDVTIDVQYPPTITQSPISQTTHLHSPALFQCSADGNPAPIITWNYQGSPIVGVQGGNFTVPSPGAEDVGTYTCVASNSVGETSADATLTVLFPPSAPTLLGAVATSSTTIFLQWTPSTDDGGSPLTNYIVEYQLSDEESFISMTTSVDILSATISGLTPYGLYEVQVRGENPVGPGDPSNSRSTRTHSEAPSSPGDFTVVSSTSSSLSLSWSEPQPLNGQLGAYQLDYGAEDTFDLSHQTRLLFTTVIEVTGVENGVTYFLRVRASTISNDGLFLWGPFSLLRVRDGGTLEIPTLPPSPSPSPSPSPVVGSSSVQPLPASSRTETTHGTSSSAVPSSSSLSSSSSSPVVGSSSVQPLPTSSRTGTTRGTSSSAVPSSPSFSSPSSSFSSSSSLIAPSTSLPAHPPSSSPASLSPSQENMTQPLSSNDDSDSEYYSVRIIPPIVGMALIDVAVVMFGVAWWYCRNYELRMRRKGIYKFSGAESGSDFELMAQLDEGEVAGDDIETSVYYVKDALDANVTYAAGPHVHTVAGREKQEEEEEEEEGEDVDTPDIGDYLTGEVRDALQESPSHATSDRPDSLEFPSLSHPSHPHSSPSPHLTAANSGSQDSLSRPPYQPGDYSYEELDAVRARKVQMRAERFRQTNPESTGYSSGGLMETRIGAVGGGARGESLLISNGHVTPGELAHMY